MYTFDILCIPCRVLRWQLYNKNTHILGMAVLRALRLIPVYRLVGRLFGNFGILIINTKQNLFICLSFYVAVVCFN